MEPRNGSNVISRRACSSLAGLGPTIPLSQALWTAVYVGMWQNILSKSIKYALFDPTKEMAYIPLDQVRTHTLHPKPYTLDHLQEPENTGTQKPLCLCPGWPG